MSIRRHITIKIKTIHCVLSSSDIGGKWRLLCSLSHLTTKHLHCIWDIVVATAAWAWRKCQTVYNWLKVEICKYGTVRQRLWVGPEQYDIILLRKSKRLDNWDRLRILGIKKKKKWMDFDHWLWLCPHTDKTHYMQTCKSEFCIWCPL